MNARAASRICLTVDKAYRVIRPGAPLWAWPARSLRELPPQCPPEIVAVYRRALERWHAPPPGLPAGSRPCLIQRRGVWLVAAIESVEMAQEGEVVVDDGEGEV